MEALYFLFFATDYRIMRIFLIDMIRGKKLLEGIVPLRGL